MVVFKIKARPFIELPSLPESRQDAFQDDTSEHSNFISSEDIPTRLNDEEGGEMDLNDDEETPEEEILDESGKDFYLSDQSDDNDSGDDDFLN